MNNLNNLKTGKFRHSGTWTPARLTNPPQFWVNDSSAVTDAGSGACSQWNDISGNGYHMTQGTAEARPLIVAAGQNGRRIIRFDNTSDFMISTAAGLASIFQNQTQGWQAIVFKKATADGASSPNRLITNNANGTTGGSRFSYASNGSGFTDKGYIVARRLDGDAAATLSMGSTLDANFHIHIPTMDWGNGDGTIYYDGAQDAQNLALTSSGSTSNTPAVANTSYVGANTVWINGDVAEIIYGRTIPSTAERQQLEGYLAHRWGLQANLPNGHPYKIYAP